MELDQFKQRFQELVSSVDPSQTVSFLEWVYKSTGGLLNIPEDTRRSQEVTTETAIINQIRDDLRQVVPVTATLPSETIVCPTVGENTDCKPNNTIHMDGFLYDEEAIDSLVDDGKISRNYCISCGSHQVSPLNFISHSTSPTQLQYMFQYLLPDVRGKTLVDVGSRLGPILYGAYLYTGASRIIGVEINSELCQLQGAIIEKYSMKDRVQLICDDICNQMELLRLADVIVMNNVFEFFLQEEAQKRIWTVIQQNVRKPGALLVTSPSLEVTFAHLKLLDLLEGWVSPVHRPDALLAAEKKLFDTAEDSDIQEIYLYSVL